MRSCGALNTQDFIREYVRNDKAQYFDLGNYDCGVSDDQVFVRDKRANDVTELSRSGLAVSSTTRIDRSYYLAAVGLLVMAFYFSLFFLRDALGNDIWIFAILGLFISPFIIRRFTSGFKVIGLYFALCIMFSVTVGSWKENDLGSGVIIFYIVGIAPYVGSRIFTRIWTVTRLELYSSDGGIAFACPEARARGLLRALRQASGAVQASG